METITIDSLITYNNLYGLQTIQSLKNDFYETIKFPQFNIKIEEIHKKNEKIRLRPKNQLNIP